MELVSANGTGAKCEHIPVPGKSKQEDAEFEASLGYIVPHQPGLWNTVLKKKQW